VREADVSYAEDRFAEFHATNPHVYERLVQLAHDARRRGHWRIGIGLLFEVLRWETLMSTESADGFKLNNNHRAYYSRLIEEREPLLRGMFVTRAQREEGTP
jgi:hypothetical protein